MIRVTVWNEVAPENEHETVLAVHPGGILGAIADMVEGETEFQVRRVHLDMPDGGITDELLEETDVLLWWGHCRHHEVTDETADKIRAAVNKGMGFIPLHSAHLAKPFVRLLGTSNTLRWRDGEYERLWCTDPGHPIAQGIPPFFDLDCEEMYGEFFDIPQPESVVFLGWFRSGEVFRSGCCWTRGLGRIFYFQPGHETDRSYLNPLVKRVVCNAVRWAAPRYRRRELDCPSHPPVEELVQTGRGGEIKPY